MRGKTILEHKFLNRGDLSNHLKYKTQAQQDECGKAIHLNDLKPIESVQKPEYEHRTNQTQDQQHPGN